MPISRVECAAIVLWSLTVFDGCRDPGSCGNGSIDYGEQCDAGGANSDSSACTTACVEARCGDGLLQVGVEGCDEGEANADDASCTASCAVARCGDVLVQDGVEECDDGDANDNAGACTTACAVASCGDGFVRAGVEECDEGAANDDSGACTGSCSVASCGDGLVHAGIEECDDGEANDDAGGCTASCVAAACGDDLLYIGAEECDDGEANDDAGDCTTSCTAAACGDGFVHAALEECDEGAGNDNSGGCTASCSVAVCGDGFVYVGVEQCDDGPLNSDTKRCTSSCLSATCGDGFVRVGVEQCDEGAGNDDAADCTGACRVAVCGDGLVHAGVEECDEGAANDDTAACTDGCVVATCGDGLVHAGVEECDDGNVLGGDGCRADCLLPQVIPLADATAKLLGENRETATGASLAFVGDLNADGLDDLVVSASDSGAGLSDGAVYLVHGPVAGTIDLSTASLKVTGEFALDYLRSGARAGDVDGDGVADLLLGAEGNDEGGLDAGAAYVVLGANLGTTNVSNAYAKLIGEAAGDLAGASVAGLDDVDGDGVVDYLIGAPVHQGAPGVAAGAAYLVLGPFPPGTSDLEVSAAVILGEAAGDWAGGSVGGAGDIDGDGLEDLLVGAVVNGEGGTRAGAAYLVLGTARGVVDLAQADAKLVGESDYEYFGVQVAGRGDYDGDGTPDLLVGAWGYDLANGAAYVVSGTRRGTIDSGTADTKLLGHGYAGNSVAYAGDVNGDGSDDLLVGAPTTTRVLYGVGEAYLMFGTVPSGVVELMDADVTLYGAATSESGGWTVSGAGDMDGDGLDDILIASIRDNEGGLAAGAVYVFAGASL